MPTGSVTENINTLNNKIDTLLNLNSELNLILDEVQIMREFQKQYSIYTTDISSKELSAMVESIDKVDDFLAKRSN